MPVVTLLLLAAAFAGQDVGPLPPATRTYHLSGPVNFCAEQFSVRLVRGETMTWTAWRNLARYSIRSGEIEARVGRDRPPAPSSLMTVTRLRLPLSPVARLYVEEIPDRTEADSQGNTRDGYDYGITYALYGAAATGRPVSVRIIWGERNPRLPFVSRIDPRPAETRRCTISRDDPALASRIVVEPGR